MLALLGPFVFYGATQSLCVARLMLWLRVCLSVCLSVRRTPVLYRDWWADRVYYKKIRVVLSLKKIRLFICGTLFQTVNLSSHSTAPTPSPTSSRGSSRECRRVVQLATGITSGNRACRTSARILARMSVSVTVLASWNSSFSEVFRSSRHGTSSSVTKH